MNVNRSRLTTKRELANALAKAIARENPAFRLTPGQARAIVDQAKKASR